jgi:quercetin dioxygenase-like cupin family protein
MITVVYPPGASDPIQRHNAHAFVYVLEGSVVMQVKGGKEVTLTPGQTFYEGPNDIHVVGRNASTTTGQIPRVFDEEQGRPGAGTSQVTSTTLSRRDSRPHSNTTGSSQRLKSNKRQSSLGS